MSEIVEILNDLNIESIIDEHQKLVESKIDSLQDSLSSIVQKLDTLNVKEDFNVDEIIRSLNKIKSITENLNLMALNASIESAKSQNDSFMVISKQITQNTDELKEILNKIQ